MNYITAIRKAWKNCQDAYEICWPYMNKRVEIETKLLEARTMIDAAIKDLRKTDSRTD